MRTARCNAGFRAGEVSTMRMIVICGWKRETLIEREVEDLGPVGRFPCLECGGDGDWSKFHPEPETLAENEKACVACKGTGWAYVGL